MKKKRVLDTRENRNVYLLKMLKEKKSITTLNSNLHIYHKTDIFSTGALLQPR